MVVNLLGKKTLQACQNGMGALVTVIMQQPVKACKGMIQFRQGRMQKKQMGCQFKKNIVPPLLACLNSSMLSKKCILCYHIVVTYFTRYMPIFNAPCFLST